MPQASVRTRTSPGPGSGTGTSATISFRSRTTAARMSHARLPASARGVKRLARDGVIDGIGAASPTARSVEHQHRARDLARLHRAERLVDVLEPAAATHHLVQLQPSLPVEVDVARHVDLEAIAAHAAALDLFLAQEHRPVELDLLSDRDHADDRRRAAGADAVEALLGRDLQADGLERVVDAAVSQRPDGLHRI